MSYLKNIKFGSKSIPSIKIFKLGTSGVKLNPINNLSSITSVTTKIEQKGMDIEKTYSNITYTWNNDFTSCTASAIQGGTNAVITETVNSTNLGTTATTHFEDGKQSYGVFFTKKPFTAQIKTKTIPCVGHNYNEPTYSWNEDGTVCTAKRTCKGDSYFEEEVGTMTYSIEAPTCIEVGHNIATATFENTVFVTQSHTYSDIEPTDHDWATPTYEWSADGSSCIATRICNTDANHIETETGTITSSVGVAPTCLEKGTTIYAASFINEGFPTNYKNIVDIPAIGHNFGEPVYTWREDGKSCTATRTCLRDESHVETETGMMSALTKTAPTSSSKGVTTYTAKFKNSGFATQTKDVADISTVGLYDANNNLLANLTVAQCEATYTSSNNLPQTLGLDKTTIAYAVIPDGTTTIGDYAFYGCSALLEVTLPNSVTSVGNYSFYQCYKIESVSMSKNLKIIGNYAFYYCNKMTSIVLPNGLISIGNNAFYYCYALASITLPNTLTSIGKYAFYYCNIDSLTIPNSVTSIGDYAFYGTKLTSITIPGNITTISSYMFSQCSRLKSVIISEGVTTINSYAFQYCSSLSSITFPSTLTTIYSNAFYSCSSLIMVNIPSSVTTIGSSAFYGAVNLVYTGSATGSPWGARCVNAYTEGDFIYTDFTKTILKGYTGNDTAVVIPNTVITIGGDVFKGKSMTSVSMSNNVTSIGTYAFYQCSSLTSITLSENLTTIGSYAFAGSGITSLVIPDSVTMISQYAFNSCLKLESLAIGAGITTIDSYVFGNCSALKSVTIPNNVTTIAANAFYYCNKMTALTIPNTVTTIGSNAFYNVINIFYSGTATGSRWGAKYMNKYVEGDFVYENSSKQDLIYWISNGNTLVIPEGVKTIGSSTFYDKSLKTITLPEGLTSIGDSAFSSCHYLTSITLPDSVTSIGGYAFNYCSELESIVIGSKVEYIGNYAFSSCSKLSSVTINNNTVMYSIGEYAFQYCSSLKTLTIPDSIGYIGRSAFSGVWSVYYNGPASGSPWDAKSINGFIDGDFIYTSEAKTTLSAYVGNDENVVIPNGVTAIGDKAFYQKSLKSVVIPNGVTTIGSYVFNYCRNLSSISLPNTLKTIGSYSFSSCNSLTTFTFPSSVTSIGQSILSTNDKLESVIMSPNITVIPNSFVYSADSLKSITIPSGVTRINNSAFYGCKSLTSLTIPSSVTSIGNYVFKNCEKLTSVTFGTTSGWYTGASQDAKTTAMSSSDLANKSTAATYLTTSYYSKYWTR